MSQNKEAQVYEKGNFYIGLVGLIIALIGLTITFFKYNEARNQNRAQNAIEAIYKIKDRDFLEALTRLKTIETQMDTISGKLDSELLHQLYRNPALNPNKNAMLDDVNFLVNAYNNLAAYYQNKLIDQDIIVQTICDEIIEFDGVYSGLMPHLPLKITKENFKVLVEACQN